MKKYCLALDLVDDPGLISEYEAYHQRVWPEIQASIRNAGIKSMEIYRLENRLFMVMEVGNDFSFEKKSQMDTSNLKVQEWEKLMWKYQQVIPGGKAGDEWRLMERIFSL